MAWGESNIWEWGEEFKMHQEIIFCARRAEVQTDQSASHDSRNDDSALEHPAEDFSFHRAHLKPLDKREFTGYWLEYLSLIRVMLYSA